MSHATELQELIDKKKRLRDAQVRKMLAQGWGPSKIARELQVTRQRAQQIVRRLSSNGS